MKFAQSLANLERYTKQNLKIGLPSADENRIVFMGDSITDDWLRIVPDFFIQNGFVNRGIGGQTTAHMLLRFRADVISLKPKVVVILGGTNDIAGNAGFSTLEMILDNLISMAELAKVNGIKVILASVLPAFDYSWRPGLEPAEKIVTLNGMIKNYCAQSGIMYLDYHSSMMDYKKGLKREYCTDGVHPNLSGYRVMMPLIEEAIVKILMTQNISTQ